MRLTDRTALVAGAAFGMGRAPAAALRPATARVVVVPEAIRRQHGTGEMTTLGKCGFAFARWPEGAGLDREEFRRGKPE